MLPLQYLNDWCLHGIYICQTEILEDKRLKLSDYFNQIEGPLATLNALQHFGSFWTPPAQAICLQEFSGCFKQICFKRGCIKILDTTLITYLFHICKFYQMQQYKPPHKKKQTDINQCLTDLILQHIQSQSSLTNNQSVLCDSSIG